MAISYHWKYIKMDILNGIVTAVSKDDDTGTAEEIVATLAVTAGQDGFLYQITIECLEGSDEINYGVIKLLPDGTNYYVVLENTLLSNAGYATPLSFSDSTISLGVGAV